MPDVRWLTIESTMLSIEGFIDWLRLPRRAVASALVACIVFLAVPKGWLALLGLDPIAPVIRLSVFGAGLLSASVLVIDLICATYALRQDRLAVASAQSAYLRRLADLTPDEPRFLRLFVSSKERAMLADHDQAALLALERAGFVHRLTTAPDRFGYLQWGIDEAAWRNLHSHPEILSPPPVAPPGPAT